MDLINIDNLFGKYKEGGIICYENRPIDIKLLYKPINGKRNKGYVDFSIDQLLKEQEERKMIVIKEYKKYFNMCLKKIKSANKLGKVDMDFSVPDSIYRCPNYNSVDCLLFIDERLKKLYLDTYIYSLNQMYVSWKNVEENRKNANKKDSE